MFPYKEKGPFPEEWPFGEKYLLQLCRTSAEGFRERLHASLVDARRLGSISIDAACELLELIGRALAVLTERVAHRLHAGGVDALRAAQLIHVSLGDDRRRLPHDLLLVLGIHLLQAELHGRVDLVLRQELARLQAEDVDAAR